MLSNCYRSLSFGHQFKLSIQNIFFPSSEWPSKHFDQLSLVLEKGLSHEVDDQTDQTLFRHLKGEHSKEIALWVTFQCSPWELQSSTWASCQTLNYSSLALFLKRNGASRKGVVDCTRYASHQPYSVWMWRKRYVSWWAKQFGGHSFGEM